MTKSDLKDFAKRYGVTEEEARDAYIGLTEKRIAELSQRFEEKIQMLSQSNDLTRILLSNQLGRIENEIKAKTWRIRDLQGKVSGGITDEDIERAKEYPIERLLSNPIRGSVTNCIAHDDRNPSMGVKNNRVKCFACGFHGSAIDVAMKLDGLDFVGAVKKLISRFPECRAEYLE